MKIDRSAIEISILKACINECELVIELFSNLSEDDFKNNQCRELYLAMVKAFQEERYINDKTIQKNYSKKGLLSDENISFINNDKLSYKNINMVDILSFQLLKIHNEPKQRLKIFEHYCRVISKTKLAHKSRQLLVSIDSLGNFKFFRGDKEIE